MGALGIDINDKTVNAIKGLVVTLVVIGGLGAAGYFIYRGIKNQRSKKDSIRENNENINELNNLTVQGKGPTLKPAQSLAIANALFSAMDGYGTAWDVIVKEFARINNEADLLSVAKAFGVKTISSGNFNPEPNFSGTLQNALKDELDSDRINALNNMLARKGIKNRI